VFFHLILVRPPLFYPMLGLNDTLYFINHNIISLKYDEILARAWHGSTN